MSGAEPQANRASERVDLVQIITLDPQQQCEDAYKEIMKNVLPKDCDRVSDSQTEQLLNRVLALHQAV